MNLDPRFTYAIIGIVVAMWLALTITSIVSDSVEVPESINGLFLTIAGAAVAKISDTRSSKKGDPHE